MDLILDRSSARTLIVFGERLITLDGRDPAWVPAIKRCLQGHRPSRLLVGLGPGSFAGTRAAIACLQGIGIAWKMQPLGFASSAVLALASGLPVVSVVGDARRGTLWLIRYAVTPERIVQLGDFRILSREHFIPTEEVVSPDADRLVEFNLRSVSLTVEWLQKAVLRLEHALVKDPLPIYLHPAVGAAHAE